MANSSGIIYFNNSATSYPKPEAVNRAICSSLYLPPIDSSRVCNCKKSDSDLDSLCKDAISKFFNLSKEYEVILTNGATYSLNIILNHFRQSGITKVLTTYQEHNSVYRTLNSLGYEINYINYKSRHILDTDILDLIDKNYIVVINHECNVDGNIIDNIQSVIDICKERDVPIILDITQSAGTECIDISSFNYNNIYIACSSHKGLFSSPSMGFLIKPISCQMKPLIFGGTGSNSFDTIKTDSLEVGTQNYLGIVSLLAGIQYINEFGLEFIQNKKKSLVDYYLANIVNMNCYSLYNKLFILDTENINSTSGIISLKVNSNKAIEFVNKLKSNNIIVRHGVHCSPLYHLRVLNCQSTIRLSFGIFNSNNDIQNYINIVDSILIKVYRYYQESFMNG